MIKKLKSKKVIIVSIMILLTSVLMLSYATFVVTTSDYKASELLISELTYSLSIYEEGSNIPIENNKIKISGNQTKIYNVVIVALNKIDSKYSLAYKSENDVSVKYSNRTPWNTEDYIKGYESDVYSKEVRIVVENKSNEEREVSIKIYGGYKRNEYEDIIIKEGYIRITEEYKEELDVETEVLKEIIEEETKCKSDNCIYGGGSKSNYLSYSNNLYRIIGTYKLNNESVTKIISENITETSNINEDLNNIYNSLEKKEETIYKTNKFNCNENGCEETEYESIGLLTKYEYEVVGGENSYLKSNEGYYVLNEGIVETQNGSELGSLKPVIYLPGSTEVTGSGTINDPYIIQYKYTVTYNENGGSGVSPKSNIVTYGGKYKLPTTAPAKEGYTLAGWYTSIEGGSQVTTSTEVTNGSNHSIYARWNPNTLILTLNNQSATSGGTGAVYYKYNTATYYSNSALSTTITKITVPTKTGYTFGGYYTAANGEGTQYINASGAFVNNPHTALKANTTLYAKWTAKTITVTYNQNGGTGVSPTSNTVTYGSKYKLPTTNPTKTGYTFAGWFTAASGGTQVTTNTTLTNASNHSIYAHWTINKYNVTVNVTNGRVTTTNPLAINHGGSGTFTIIANSGYKLDGASVSCTGGSYNQAGSLTVTNVTSARTCTITLAQSKVTFTMNSSSCPDRANNNSSPCYIISHYDGYFGGTWDGTAYYEGKTYSNCKIDSRIEKYGANCEKEFATNNNHDDFLYWTNTGDNSGYRWCKWDSENDNCYHARCSVTLTCG